MKVQRMSRHDLQGVVSCWNENIGERFPMPDELFYQNSLADQNVACNASLVVKDKEKVIGFIVGKYYQEDINVGFNEDTANIQVLLVDKSYREQGLGTKLLNQCIKALDEEGKNLIRLGRDPWHYFPGIPLEDTYTQQWFKKRGFQQGPYVDTDMIRSFRDDEPFESLKNANAQFELLNASEKENLISFIHQNFPGRWEYEAYKYFELGGTGRDFIILKVNDEIQGFCRMNDQDTPMIGCNVNWSELYDERVGGIGPLGVSSNVRGTGLGLDIVKVAINTLRAREAKHIIIDWTGLIEFYQKVGFEEFKKYRTYFKKLNKGEDE
ncbi:Acetyltransferase, GNAT family [Piscibacillus halophilus]|uniref:Acetyltransferase, GNAT family n=2 Tax=Piscibacillus halophilus TaxID=571933 RepID=A0A1H9I2H1_9BACI|nr:Acetyltransferase, GNAT family [Piscibacillus halophilus]